MTWIPQTTTLEDCVSVLDAESNLLSLYSEEDFDPEIVHLSYNSQDVKAGTLFFCKGAHFKLEYLLQAVEAGAVAYVSEHDYTDEFTARGIKPAACLQVNDIRTAIADVAARFYRGLLSHLTLIGITGTKGKSTTTYMVRSILDRWLEAKGKKESAWLSTIDNYDGVSRTRSSLTTQDVLELYQHFRNAVDSGIEYLTMEVSSQALKYHRTRNLYFKVACFLNIGEDHVSDIEHPNHEDYFASKLQLFLQADYAVINRQSDEYERIWEAALATERIFTFTQAADNTDDAVGSDNADSIDIADSVCSSDVADTIDTADSVGSSSAADTTDATDSVGSSDAADITDATGIAIASDTTGTTDASSTAEASAIADTADYADDADYIDVVASDIHSTPKGIRFTAEAQRFKTQFLLPMAGLFNVENALAAITIAVALHIPVKFIKRGLAECQVNGRMQLVPGPKNKLIIIDYAHNKLSFETIFSTVAREYPDRPIVAVFGATGGKGAERRRELPEVAVTYASKLYITEDDAGEEPLEQINQQIAEVVRQAGVPYDIIEDRDEAIFAAIHEAPPESIILVLGKGHETVMKRGTESVPVPSDNERVKRILATQ